MTVMAVRSWRPHAVSGCGVGLGHRTEAYAVAVVVKCLVDSNVRHT
jgi:hypothetical protein